MTALATPTAGGELKKLREVCGLSQNKLAGLARVSAAALSRWESGQRVPNIPELEATLTALEASVAQKRAILRLINAPRAVLQLRALDTTGSEAAVNGGGNLLWAMRKRRGWTQTETARAAQVMQSQIARWERGEAWPDVQKLHALCWVLQALPEEVAALTGEAVLGGVQGGAQGVLAGTWDKQQWAAYVDTLLSHPPPDALTDLTFIRIEQQLAQLAHQHDFAATLLPDVYAIHARQHYYRNRFSESVHWAEQGFALLRQREVLEATPPLGAPFWFGNVLSLVSQAIRNKRPAGLRRGAALLRDWLPVLRQSMKHRRASAEVRESAAAHYAWGQMNMANVINLLGYGDEAVTLGKEACQNAEQVRPGEAFMRWRDYAGLLHTVGHSARAIDALAQSQRMVQWENAVPDTVARQCLLEADCFVALDDIKSADERSREAERIIKGANLHYLETDLYRVTALL